MPMPMPMPMPKLMLLPRSTGRRGTGGVGLVGSAGWTFVGAAGAIVGYVAGVARRGSLGCCCCGYLRMWPDDAVVFRGFLWIRPPAMRIHSPVRTRAVKLFTASAVLH